MVNLIEPGDRVVVAVAGVFGERLAEQAHRNGAEVVTVEAKSAAASARSPARSGASA